MGVLSSLTPFGSRQTLGVVARRRRWLKVNAAVLPDGRFAWIRAAHVRITRTRWAVRISRVRRRLTVLDGSRAVRSFPVGIGSATSPTPLGRFTVTDELPGSRYSPVYGCCILALSGTQSHLPTGYRGGDRLAIHGTNVPRAIGGTDSLGCIYTGDGDLRYLVRRLPLGTPVTIVR
jgi:lipoprotein-anchoring transpeptidase ErfK/SrfK